MNSNHVIEETKKAKIVVSQIPRGVKNYNLFFTLLYKRLKNILNSYIARKPTNQFLLHMKNINFFNLK